MALRFFLRIKGKKTILRWLIEMWLSLERSPIGLNTTKFFDECETLISKFTTMSLGGLAKIILAVLAIGVVAICGFLIYVLFIGVAALPVSVAVIIAAIIVAIAVAR